LLLSEEQETLTLQTTASTEKEQKANGTRSVKRLLYIGTRLRILERSWLFLLGHAQSICEVAGVDMTDHASHEKSRVSPGEFQK